MQRVENLAPFSSSQQPDHREVTSFLPAEIPSQDHLCKFWRLHLWLGRVLELQHELSPSDSREAREGLLLQKA